MKLVPQSTNFPRSPMNTARLGVVLPALFLKAQTNYQRDIGISFPVTL